MKRPLILLFAFLISFGVLLPSHAQDTVKKAKQKGAKVQKKEQTVYVTRTGAKYHTGSCRYLRKSKIPMNLSDARALYDPCSVCEPAK